MLTRTYNDLLFWRAQCCKELTLSGTLAPEGGSLEYWDLWSSSYGLCMGKALLASYNCLSSSCPTLIWESRRDDFVTSTWQLGWYPWVLWSIKLSLVNTVSGFLRGTNALEKKKMSFIDSVPKAMVSYNCGVHCFGSLSSRTKAFSYSIKYSVTEASSPCLCFVPKMSPLTVLARRLWAWLVPTSISATHMSYELRYISG